MPPPSNKTKVNQTTSSSKYGWSRAENDFCSWMLLNGDDLFPSLVDSNLPSQSFLLDQNNSESNARNTPLLDGLVSPNDSGPVPSNKLSSSLYRDLDDSSEEDQTKSGPGGASTKREERLLRNREIARNCRKRKREKIEAMQIELQQLKEDKQQLEMKVLQLQKAQSVNALEKSIKASSSNPHHATSTSASAVDIRRAEFREIDRLLSKHDELFKLLPGSSRVSLKDEPMESFETPKDLGSIQEQIKSIQEELESKLNICKELHSDFGTARENEVKFHMKQLEKMLVPNQLSKMTLWSLQQEDDFYDETSNFKKFGGGLWNTLCAEFNLSKEQKAGLIAMRKSIRMQRENVTECLKILKELETRVTANFDGLKSQMKEIMTITTPVQQARFLMWIEKNQTCMYMLNNLWEQEKKEAKKEAEEVVLNVKVESNPQEDELSVSNAEMEAALKSGKTLNAMRALIEKKLCSS